MLSGGGSSLPAARPCIARGKTLHLVNLAPEHIFVQAAGETDAQRTRQAADDVDE
jgi:hypothetical protein